MEIGEHGIHAFEPVAWIDKQVAAALARRNPAPRVGTKLQGPHRSSAHGNNPAPGPTGLVNRFSRLLIDNKIFRVNLMIPDILNPHRDKGAIAYMQGNSGHVHTLFRKRCE